MICIIECTLAAYPIVPLCKIRFSKHARRFEHFTSELCRKGYKSSKSNKFTFRTKPKSAQLNKVQKTFCSIVDVPQMWSIFCYIFQVACKDYCRSYFQDVKDSAGTC